MTPDYQRGWDDCAELWAVIHADSDLERGRREGVLVTLLAVVGLVVVAWVGRRV